MNYYKCAGCAKTIRVYMHGKTVNLGFKVMIKNKNIRREKHCNTFELT